MYMRFIIVTQVTMGIYINIMNVLSLMLYIYNVYIHAHMHAHIHIYIYTHILYMFSNMLMDTS